MESRSSFLKRISHRHWTGLPLFLARDKNLLSRDIKVVDLRLRDRVSVRSVGSPRRRHAADLRSAEKLKKEAGNA